jgi:hypothetical protein
MRLSTITVHVLATVPTYARCGERKEEKQGQKGVAIKSTKLPDIRPIKYTSYSTHNTGSFTVLVNTSLEVTPAMETKVYVVFDVIKHLGERKVPFF